jgi:hypothetical protein
MKSLSKFKQEPTVILEEEKTDYSKFDMLVRAGLANKAQIQRLHVILDKMQEERPVFSNADRAIMQNLFNKMVDLISNNKQLFQQTRRLVREELEEGVKDSSAFKVVTDAAGNQRKVKAHRVVINPDTVVADKEQVKEEVLDENVLQRDPPAVLVLRRKNIRSFSNDTFIALYYNDKLNKYFSIPYSTNSDINSPIQAEEVQIDEAKINGIDQLKKIRDSKQHGTVNHLDGSASKVDGFTASAILQVHDKLNDENKKKIANMVSSSHYHLSKVANFAFSKSK